jgi:RNA polymerase sigma-70 factor (ECF subfamily)
MAPSAPPRRSRIAPSAEEAALASLRRGQRDEALKILMIAYDTAIIAFSLRILRDRELARDVAQQVFLNAYRRFDTFEGRGSLWSWLCGIASRRCIDELRRRRTEGADRFDVWDELVGPSDPSMDPDRVARQRALERCLGKLSDSMRTQVLMRCFLGLSYEEIGELIGDASGTVQVRISRILPRLRRCLRNEGVHR